MGLLKDSRLQRTTLSDEIRPNPGLHNVCNTILRPALDVTYTYFE